MRWLAYVHPLLMAASLLLAVQVLRLGLRLRSARLARRATDPARHVALARWVVPLVVFGWTAGLASMAWLRERPLLESAHFPLASAAALGIGAAGCVGLALERGRALGARSAHALLGAGGLLLGLAAAVAGMAILP
jgi:hypothetical protein